MAMTVTASFDTLTGTLQAFGDIDDDVLVVSRDATRRILLDAGAIAIAGGVPTVPTTTLITASGMGGNDSIALDETNGPLPPAMLFGLRGDDTLVGGSGADTLDGGSGRDSLEGADGADQVFGGDGNDTIAGGRGNDLLSGDLGNDLILWGRGDGSDTIEGGDGSDTLQVEAGGDAGSFAISAAGGRIRIDRIDGTAFTLDIGGVERVEMRAGGGNDTVSTGIGLSGLAALLIDGGGGDDLIVGGSDAETLLGGDGNDTISGGQGNDLVRLGAGQDRFVWNPGDGSDTVNGEGGTDTLVFNGSAVSEIIAIGASGGHALLTRNIGAISLDLVAVEAVALNLSGGADAVTIGSLGRTDIRDVTLGLAASTGGGDGAVDAIVLQGGTPGEIVTIGLDAGDILVSGLAASVRITDAEAQDRLTIQGLGGRDRLDAGALLAGRMQITLDGGVGNDTLIGSGGADMLIGGDGNDTVSGGFGSDVAFLGDGNDTFAWSPGDGSDIVEGQAGLDTLVFAGSAISEIINVGPNGGRVVLTRDVGAVLMDLNGVETLDLRPGSGLDQISVGDLSGTGVQQVRIDLAGALGVADAADDAVTASGTAGADTISLLRDGAALVVQGGAARVALLHADATDRLTVNALGGDDLVDASGFGTPLLLTLVGGLGADTLVGSAGNDTLSGGDGNDSLLGGAGDDLFVWNPGDDNDVLEGQAGLDTLQFNGANVSETINILANGTRALFTRDIANVSIDAGGVETIRFLALGGADSIRVGDLTGTAVTTVRLDLGIDGQVDTVTIDGTAGADVIKVASLADGSIHVTGLSAEIVLTGFEAADRIVIRGFGGDDVIDATDLHLAIGLTEDGGDGADVLIGGDFSDILLGGPGDDVLIGGPGTDVLDGGTGSNILLQ